MAISGNHFLVHDGIIRVVDDRELHPRTAVGVDADTGEVLLLVVDGRSSRSRGYTMVELANLMIDLGADEAVNLDGGGSSTMVARNREGKVAVLEQPLRRLPALGRQRPRADLQEALGGTPAGAVPGLPTVGGFGVPRFTRAELESFRDAEVPDLLGPGLKLLFVGINPGLWTAATRPTSRTRPTASTRRSSRPASSPSRSAPRRG